MQSFGREVKRRAYISIVLDGIFAISYVIVSVAAFKRPPHTTINPLIVNGRADGESGIEPLM